MSWLNKNTGVVHAHRQLGNGADPDWTACGRVRLWRRGENLRDDFEYRQPQPGDRLCQHCVAAVQWQIDYRLEWLAGADS